MNQVGPCWGKHAGVREDLRPTAAALWAGQPAQEGPMQVYRREADENGMTTDRLKAAHYIEGISAQVDHVQTHTQTHSHTSHPRTG